MAYETYKDRYLYKFNEVENQSRLPASINIPPPALTDDLIFLKNFHNLLGLVYLLGLVTGLALIFCMPATGIAFYSRVNSIP